MTNPVGELDPRERELVDKRRRPRAAVLLEAIRLEGAHELCRPASSLALSGCAAGLSLGFSMMAQGVLWAALPDRPWRHLLVALGYTAGFYVVVIARQQLFTENTVTPIIPLLQSRNRATLLRVLRLWGIVLVTNLLGTLAFALVCARTDAFSPEVRNAFARIERGR